MFSDTKFHYRLLECILFFIFTLHVRVLIFRYHYFLSLSFLDIQNNETDDTETCQLTFFLSEIHRINVNSDCWYFRIIVG